MKLLIAGSAGFMGSHLFDEAMRKGHEVRGMDNYSIGRYEHPLIQKCDLTDYEDTKAVVSRFKPDVIVNMAAWAHEGLSQFMPMKITENNYNAHLNLLTAGIRHEVKRYVLASSMSVYGDQDPPFREDMPRNPVDVYGIAKSSAEASTEVLCKVHDTQYTIIRPHNVYGPRQAMHDPYRNVVAIFMNRAMQNKPLYIYGNGTQIRAFTYIDDVTKAFMHALDDPIMNKEIYNVGPDRTTTIQGLAMLVRKIMDSESDIEFLPMRPQEVQEAYCTNDKLAHPGINYTPLEAGLEAMATWAKSQGPAEPQYLKEGLELESHNTPSTWTEKLL